MKKLWLDIAGERPEISEARDMVGFVLRAIAIIFFVLSFFCFANEARFVRDFCAYAGCGYRNYWLGACLVSNP
jgi:hypothetical protein